MPRGPRYAQAHYNLRLYLSEAVLPTMGLAEGAPTVPQDTRTPPTDFLLSPEADSRRKLRRIFLLQPSVVEKKLMTFLSANIPNRPMYMPGAHVSDDDERFLLPAESFYMEFEEPPPMGHIGDLCEWVEVPLTTAERVLRTVWPEDCRGFLLTSQPFRSDLRTGDAEIYRTFHWSQTAHDPNDVNQAACKLVVAAIAPWALSPTDMSDFAKVVHFPAFSIQRNANMETKLNKSPVFQRSHKVWAKLWDDCTRERCPYFVISVYHGWIFGVFTHGWTTASVSQIIKHTESKPSVLEWLVFWISAAMGLPGAWTPPSLRHYRNPDITNPHNVATKISTEWGDNDEEVMPHHLWLKKYHRYEKRGGSSKLCTFAGLANIWITQFEQRIGS